MFELESFQSRMHALHRSEGVVVTHMHVPSGASRGALAEARSRGFPEALVGLYEQCDGLEVYWRHRESWRDEEWFQAHAEAHDVLRATHTPLKARPSEHQAHRLEHFVSGTIQIQPLSRLFELDGAHLDAIDAIDEVFSANPSLQTITMSVGGEESLVADAWRSLNPFDLFTPDSSVFFHPKSGSLFRGYQYKDVRGHEISVESYLDALVESCGLLDMRGPFFEGEAVPAVVLGDPESLLQGAWVGSR